VVGEFVAQSESAESILEALIRSGIHHGSHNILWLIIVKLKSLLLKIHLLHGCCVYICDFQREQSWERWVRDKKHQLTEGQG